MGKVDAGTIKGSGRVVYRTTVHGPVTGYAQGRGQDGRARPQARELRPRHPLAAPVPRPHDGQGPLGATTFRTALAQSPFTFNVGYADDRDIAMYSAGCCPSATRRSTRGFPTQGHGRVRVARLPQGLRSTRTRSTRPAACCVNWNNRPAPKWGAADDNWAYGSVQRVRMLTDGLAKREQHDLASVTSAMNAAATQDLRSVALTPVAHRRC